jgi:hypothetical protein
VRTYTAKQTGSGFDFTTPENTWYCEDSEIDAVLAFISGQVDSPGTYTRIEDGSPLAKVIAAVKDGSVEAQQVDALVVALAASNDVKTQLADRESANLLVQGVQLVQQKNALDKLQAAVDNPAATEPAFQSVLDKNWWLFGGRYIGTTLRRSFTVLDQNDVPLIRPDRSTLWS